MGDLIQFPTPEPEPKHYIGVSVEVSGLKIQIKCDDPVHSFTDIESRCECGKHTWAEVMA